MIRAAAPMLAALVLVALSAGPVAQARDSTRGGLPAGASEEVPGLKPFGAGTFRWFGLKVYDASLWTRGAPPEFGQPFSLSLRYARSLKGTAIAQRSVEEIEALALGTPEKRRAWGLAMERLFPDVVEGNTLTGLHLPGRGAKFFHDGRPLGAIADPEFSHAFFSIWLDPATSAPDLRAALLGGR